MDSIIKPLTDKVVALEQQLNTITRLLVRGDPTALPQLENLLTGVQNMKAEFKSNVATMKASYEASIATASGSINPSSMLKTITFYVKEVFYAIELLSKLFSFLANLLSINTILALMFNELEQLRSALNMKLLWLTRALNRTKQKIQKQIEWEKRTITAQLTIKYLQSSKKTTEASLEQLKNTASTSSNNKPTPRDGYNGSYIAGTFVYYDTPEQQANKKAQVVLEVKLKDIDTEITDNQKELDIFIPNDKDFWKKKWESEEKKDKQELLNITPKLDADLK